MTAFDRPMNGSLAADAVRACAALPSHEGKTSLAARAFLAFIIDFTPLYVIQSMSGLKERTFSGLQVHVGDTRKSTGLLVFEFKCRCVQLVWGEGGGGGPEIVVGRCPGTLLVHLIRVGGYWGRDS